MATDRRTMSILDNHIDFNGKSYPCRWVTAPLFKDEYQENYLIATESLEHALLQEGDIPISKHAEMIDNQVFFYVNDDEIALDEITLRNILIKNVA